MTIKHAHQVAFNMSDLIIEKNDLNVVSEFNPAGDQPAAIEELVGGLRNGEKNQVLLGAH